MRSGRMQIRPLGGWPGCLLMIVFSVVASVVLTVPVKPGDLSKPAPASACAVSRTCSARPSSPSPVASALGSPPPPRPRPPGSRPPKHGKQETKPDRRGFAERSVEERRDRACELEIEGRASMSKDELIAASASTPSSTRLRRGCDTAPARRLHATASARGSCPVQHDMVYNVRHRRSGDDRSRGCSPSGPGGELLPIGWSARAAAGQ